MAKLEFNITFEVPAKVIYNAFVDQYEVLQYTRSPGVVENKEGGVYKILDGRIDGVFQKLVENTEIAMTWKFSDWKDYSLVHIKFVDREDSVQVKIVQTNLPQGTDVKQLEHGWRNYIFLPMSKIRGYPLENDD
ncbi:hypothetical protein pb186bvf_008965 [Paramecium bursaria]